MLTRIPKDHVVSPIVDEDPILAGLMRQIAESEVFRTAPMMRRLVHYLWQNRGESISEYAIATEALGRNTDFDSRSDASVRVQVARLRLKLTEFYAREGENFPLRLSIPVGGHEIEWSLKPIPLVPDTVAPAAPVAVPWRTPFIAATGAAVLLAIACIALVVRVQILHSSPASVHPAPPRFWNTFLANGKPTDLVIPDLNGFHWPDQHIYVIAPNSPEFEKWNESPFLSDLAKKWGPPALNQTYLFGRDAFAGFRINQYLEQYTQQVQIVEGANYGAERQAAHNTIFLGRPSSSAHIRQFFEKTNFSMVNTLPMIVENKHPLSGEPASYQEQQLSSSRRICPGILTLLPPKTDGARVMLLAGRYANVFSTLLVTEDGLKIVDKAWRNAGMPEAWEMVIQAEIEGSNTVLKMTPAALRPIASTFWN